MKSLKKNKLFAATLLTLFIFVFFTELGLVKFPAIVNATPSFGYSGSSSDASALTSMRGSKAVLSEDGTVTSLSAKISGAPPINIKIGIYDSSKNSIYNTTAFAADGYGAIATTVASIYLTAGTYYFGVIGDAGTLGYSTSVTTDYCVTSYTYPDLPSAWGDTIGSDRSYIIYANYTAGSAPTFSAITASSKVISASDTLTCTVSAAAGVSGHIVSTNNTGTFVNGTWTSGSSVSYGLTNNGTAGNVLSVIIYANDTNNLWGTSDTTNFILLNPDGNTIYFYDDFESNDFTANTGSWIATSRGDIAITSTSISGSYSARLSPNYDVDWIMANATNFGISNMYLSFQVRFDYLPTTTEWAFPNIYDNSSVNIVAVYKSAGNYWGMHPYNDAVVDNTSSTISAGTVYFYVIEWIPLSHNLKVWVNDSLTQDYTLSSPASSKNGMYGRFSPITSSTNGTAIIIDNVMITDYYPTEEEAPANPVEDLPKGDQYVISNSTAYSQIRGSDNATIGTYSSFATAFDLAVGNLSSSQTLVCNATASISSTITITKASIKVDFYRSVLTSTVDAYMFYVTASNVNITNGHLIGYSVGGNSNYAIRFANCYNGTVDGVTTDAFGESGGGGGVYAFEAAYGAYNVTFKNCVINGIVDKDCAGILLSHEGYQTITNCTFTNMSQGIFVGSSSMYNVITNCKFVGDWHQSGFGHAIYLDGSGGVGGYNTVSGCTFYNQTASNGAGLQIKCHYNSIYNNTFYNFTNSGAPCFTIYSQYSPSYANDNDIFNNTFTDCVSAFWLGHDPAEYITDGNKIHNNTFVSVTNCIMLNPWSGATNLTSNTKIYNNTFTSCTTIFPLSGSSASLITNTQIYDNDFSGTSVGSAITTYMNTVIYNNTAMTGYKMLNQSVIGSGTTNTTGLGWQYLTGTVVSVTWTPSGGNVRQDFSIDGSNQSTTTSPISITMSADHITLAYFTGTPSDTEAPTVTLISPTATTYASSSITLTFSVSETESWSGYSLSGAANVTSGNTTLTGFVNGTYTIRVYANDTSGNMGLSALVSFDVEIITTDWYAFTSISFKDLDNGAVLTTTWQLYNVSDLLSYTLGQCSLLSGTYTLKTYYAGSLINTTDFGTATYGNGSLTVYLQLKQGSTYSIAFDNPITSLAINSENSTHLSFTATGSEGPYTMIIPSATNATYVSKDGVNQTYGTIWTFDSSNHAIVISTASLSDWDIDWTESSTPATAGTARWVLNTLFAIIFSSIILLGIGFLALIGVGIIKMDDALLAYVIIIGIMIVVGIAIALAFMGAIQNSGIIPAIILQLFQ